MRKLVLVLTFLMVVSCDTTDDCNCIKKSFNIEYDKDISYEDYALTPYSLEPYKVENIDCTDETAEWEDENTLIVINCN